MECLHGKLEFIGKQEITGKTVYLYNCVQCKTTISSEEILTGERVINYHQLPIDFSSFEDRNI